MADKKFYRIKPGNTIYILAEEREAQAGELIELTQGQVDAWKDMVEPAGVSDKTMAAITSSAPTQTGDPDEQLTKLGLEASVIQKLKESGYTTVESLKEAENSALSAIKGIGPATVQEIRQAIS